MLNDKTVRIITASKSEFNKSHFENERVNPFFFKGRGCSHAEVVEVSCFGWLFLFICCVKIPNIPMQHEVLCAKKLAFFLS